MHQTESVAIAPSETEEEERESAEWPPAPPDLPHDPELEIGADRNPAPAGTTEGTDETDDDDEEDEDSATAEAVAPVEGSTEPPATEDAPPPDPKRDRGQRRRERILNEYRESEAYQAELERATQARIEADRLEREQAAEAQRQRERVEQATLSHRQRIAKYLGTTAAEVDGRQVSEYDRDAATVARIEAKVLADAETVEDGFLDLDQTVQEEYRTAKARVRTWDDNRAMQRLIDDAAWTTIKDDYDATVEHPALAGADPETLARIRSPQSLRDGIRLALDTATTAIQASHAAALDQLKAAHAEKVAALEADLSAWKARAGGAVAQVETRAGAPNGPGGLTLERYRRMTPDEQADLKPDEIDRMMAAELQRRQQQR